MKLFLNTIAMTGLLLGFANIADAVPAGYVEVDPVSYSFDKATDTGSYAYHDWTGNQLTDGEYGVAPWNTNLGNGTAYEWVGWVYDTPVNIDFDFGSSKTINKIDIGTVQDHTADVVIPSVELFSSQDGITWSSFSILNNPESSSNNNLHLTLAFDNLDVTSQYFRVTLTHSLDGPWTFTDEIDFYKSSSAQAPTPAILLLISTGLIGVIGVTRRKA